MRYKLLTSTLMLVLTLPVSWAGPAVGGTESVGVVSPGCYFGAITTGVLGVASDMKAVGTSVTSGRRPSITMHFTHTATVHFFDPTWHRDGLAVYDIASQSGLYGTATGWAKYQNPHTQTTLGASRTYWWDVAGNSETAFFNSGKLTASTVISCI